MASATTRVLELAAAGIAVAFSGLIILIRRSVPRRVPPQRKLIVLDSLYSLKVLRARQAEYLVAQRDLDGFFHHVWSVHPIVGAAPDDPPEERFGPLTFIRLSGPHTRVEAKAGRFRPLERFPYLNFALSQIELFLRLDRIMRDEGVGIIRGDPYYMGLVALGLGRLNGAAVEVRVAANFDAIYESVGGLAYPRLLRWRSVERMIARLCFRFADSVEAGSDDNRKFAIANGARPERMSHIGPWRLINPAHWQDPDERESLPDEFGFGDRPIVGAVCRLELVKHPEDVLRCIAEARAHNPKVAGVIAGEGAMLHELLELRSQLNLDGHFVCAGDRDQQWLARFLTDCAAIVVPLAGLALVEAALSETPIVAYDVEWHSELIETGETGVLVPYRDVQQLVQAVLSLIDDPAEARKLGRAARERVLKKMDPSKVVRSEQELAERLLRVSATRSAKRWKV